VFVSVFLRSKPIVKIEGSSSTNKIFLFFSSHGLDKNIVINALEKQREVDLLISALELDKTAQVAPRTKERMNKNG